MSERSSIFDMIGPVMIGPSSSHTAGCARLARMARLLLGEVPTEATITFYNSFAHTYQGHGSDRACIGGLLNYAADDARIRDALQHADTEKLKYQFKTAPNALNYHPNTVRFALQGKANNALHMLGISTGGGKISIEEINGYNTHFSAGLPTLVLFSHDTKGNIAFVTSLISHQNCNIATMTVSRKARQDATCMVIDMDTQLPTHALNYLQNCASIEKAILLPGLYA